MRDVGSSGRDQRVGQGSPVGNNQLGEIQYLEKTDREAVCKYPALKANISVTGLDSAQAKQSLVG